MLQENQLEIIESVRDLLASIQTNSTCGARRKCRPRFVLGILHQQATLALAEVSKLLADEEASS